MEWIAVSQRLPEDNNRVLCFLMDTDPIEGFVDVSNYDGEDWWDVGDFVVSHWMPLHPVLILLVIIHLQGKIFLLRF